MVYPAKGADCGLFGTLLTQVLTQLKFLTLEV